jgi:hypothetical protein
MFALAFESQPEKNRRAVPSSAKRPKTTATNLTVHDRFVCKAEAVFPGSEILFHQSKEH